MAWTGSEPELVGTDGGATSTDWEWVPDKKEAKVEVDEEVSKLADDLNQVISLDEPDFPTPEDPPKEPSSWKPMPLFSRRPSQKRRTFPPPLPHHPLQQSLQSLHHRKTQSQQTASLAFPPFNLWSRLRLLMEVGLNRLWCLCPKARQWRWTRCLGGCVIC